MPKIFQGESYKTPLKPQNLVIREEVVNNHDNLWVNIGQRNATFTTMT